MSDSESDSSTATSDSGSDSSMATASSPNFEAAVSYLLSLDPTDAQRLKLSAQRICILYCLYKQATAPCWTLPEDATHFQRMLHRGWAALPSMPAETAYEHFVKLLEGSQVIKPPNSSTDQITINTRKRWLKVDTQGERPHPRCQHGAVTALNSLYVYGGCSDGHNFHDIQVLNLSSFKWSKAAKVPRWARGSEFSSHSMCLWESSIIVTGYTGTPPTITVIEFDLLSCIWRKLKTRGRAPRPRTGQSMMVVGDSLLVFGGDDNGEKSNAIDILCLFSRRWVTRKTTGKIPCPRSHHISVCHRDRYLLVFGGISDKGLLSDLHEFDLDEGKWFEVQTEGETPTELSSQAGVIDGTGSNLFIVGVTPKTGDSQTFMLDLSTFYWELVTQSKGPTTFAKKGLSLSSSPFYEFLIAFGGSNDSCSNEVHVLKPSYGQTEIEACGMLTAEDINIPDPGDLSTLFTPEKILEAIRRDGENHEHEKELSLPAGMNPEFKKIFVECNPSSGDVQDLFTSLFVAVKDQLQMMEAEK